MRYLILSLLFLTACQFHPLYSQQTIEGICVTDIPENSGFLLQQKLEQHFPNKTDCSYRLVVNSPTFSLSDQSVSDKDFITMQKVQAKTSYKLLNSNNNVLLSDAVAVNGSSAVVSSPYSTVVSVEKTQMNLIPILADQISLHISAFLDRTQP